MTQPPDPGGGPAAALPPPSPVPAADGGWHRLHPVTPVVRGWKVIAVLLVIFAQQGGDDLFAGSGLPSRTQVLLSVGVLAAGALAAAVYSVLSWRMTRFRVDDEAVQLHSGVLFRQQRQARLDRLQAVDVVRPFLARLLGLAELRLEVAGGSGSGVRLSYLREVQAQGLRNTLLARAAGVSYDTEDAPEAPEHLVVQVPVDRLLVSLLRSGTTIATLLAVAALLVVLVGFRQPGALAALGPVLLGLVGASWARFTREFGFRVAVSPDGVRLRHGLLEQRAQTLPPGRVQAISVSQPLLWRGRDWWRIQVNVAGYAGGGPGEGQLSENVLLPVGSRREALQVLGLALPDLGTASPDQTVADGLTGAGPERGWTAAPRQARWVDPVGWRRNGYLVTGTALLARRGRLHRHLDVVPHARTQSLGLSQGPLQRRLGLASVVAHSTPGPVSPRVPHLAVQVASGLLADQARRARLARAVRLPERWMETASPGPGASADGVGVEAHQLPAGVPEQDDPRLPPRGAQELGEVAGP